MEHLLTINTSDLDWIFNAMVNSSKLLNYYLFSFEKDIIKISSSDLLRYAEVMIPNANGIATKFAVSNKISKLVKNVVGDVSFHEAENYVVVSQGRTRYKLPKVDFSSFPEFPDMFSYEKQLSIPASIFKKGIHFVSHAASSDYPYIQMTVKNKEIFFVATNGELISIARSPIDLSDISNASAEFTFIIAKEHLPFLMNLSTYDMLTIETSPAFFKVSTKYLTSYFRILEAQTIDYERFLLPSDKYVFVDALEFKSKLNISRTIGDILEISIDSSSETMYVKSKDDTSEMEDELKLLKNKGFTYTGTLKQKNVFDAVSKISSSELYIYQIDTGMLSFYSKEDDWKLYSSVAEIG